MVQKRMSNLTCLLAMSVLVAGVEVSAQPQNAPTSQQNAIKMLEIEKANDKSLSKTYGELLSSIDKVPARYDWNSYSPKYRLVIVNYGGDEQIERREKLFMRELGRFRLYHTRITIVRGGTCKSERTIFWQMLFEPGAANPDICDDK